MSSRTPKTVSVIGAGYVGLTTAVLFAEAGHSVHLIEIAKDRLKQIKKGRSFFYETGINPLISHAIKTGKLVPTNSYADAIPDSNFVFSCVGTPDNPDGSSNLDFVYAAANSAISLMDNDSIFVQKSTVPVGTGQHIEKLIKKAGKEIHYVSNPEFLREGTAISDTLWFDRIVAGGASKKSVESVLDLYRLLETHRSKIAKRAGLKNGNQRQGKFIATSLNSAELIKVTANAFLALKISFANSIAKLADQTDADITEVMDAVGADARIGRAFLNAGRGYGGGCFPKDVSGLISSASEYGVDLSIMREASEVNESMPGYIVNKAKNVLGELNGKSIAVLGLAFKAGTSDVRRSPGVNLANILHKNDANVTVYDPEANGEARYDLRKGVKIAPTINEAVKNADALFITTDWPEFTSVNLQQIAKLMKGNLFIDGMNIFKVRSVRKSGLKYIGVGR